MAVAADAACACAADLFRAVFPGEVYSKHQNSRLAAELRRTADLLDPDAVNEEAQDLADVRAPSGNGASGDSDTLAPPRPAPKKRRWQKAGRPIEFAAYHQRYVALEITYLGWDHHGFASQADTENTIEGHLWSALRRLRLVPQDSDWHVLRYSRCGRTDKGVSALGQVVALLLRSSGKVGAPLPDWRHEQDYAHMLNRVLPDTIRVLAWADVPQDFHARFGARYREYKYFMTQDSERPLDIPAMLRAAGYLVGEHDFRNFCKMDVEHVLTFRRTVFHARVEMCPSFSTAGRDVCLFNIRGTAFLWHQVRCLAEVLLMVGHGHEQPDIVQRLLDVEAVPCKPQYLMASEEPLLLAACEYPLDIEWHRSPGMQAALQSQLRTMLHCQIVKTSLLATIEERIATDANGSRVDEAVRTYAVKGQPHIPLLQRYKEPSMQERLQKLGRTTLGQ